MWWLLRLAFHITIRVSSPSSQSFRDGRDDWDDRCYPCDRFDRLKRPEVGGRGQWYWIFANTEMRRSIEAWTFVCEGTPISEQEVILKSIYYSSTVRISLPFKEQVAAYAVRKQLRDLSHKIGPTFQPVFVSKKLGQNLGPKSSRQSWISSVLFTIFHVICAMQIMSRKQPDTFINALLSTKIRESVDISLKLTVTSAFWKKTNSQF